MKKVSKFLWGILCCVALLFTACVQPELSVYGNISGVVKDAITNKPLDGVRVTITPRGLSQVTESDGQFMFTDLEVGEYTLTFEKVGYAENTQKVLVVAGSSASVQVTMNENQIGVDISPQQLNFGSSTSTLQLIMQSDGRTSYYRASATADWITLSQTDGSITGKEVLYVSVSRAGLAAGEYTGSIRISINDKYITIPVLMTVTNSSVAVVSLERIIKTTSSEIYMEGVLLSIGDDKGVTDFGICYSPTNSIPTINDTKQTLGSSKEPKSFSCSLSGLKSDQVYFLRAYAINEKGVAYSENVLTAQTEKAEEGQTAKLRSSNDNISIELLSCKRMPSGRIQMETLIQNTGIGDYTDFRICAVGRGYSWEGQSWTTEVIDDFATDYNEYSLKMSLNGAEGYGISTSLPLDAKKKFIFTIQDVPENANRISVHISAMFYAYPSVYVFLTYDNVPID